MPEAIPEKYRDLFNKRAFASLATLMPDGRPQVTPVWCDLEGDYVSFQLRQRPPERSQCAPRSACGDGSHRSRQSLPLYGNSRTCG